MKKPIIMNLSVAVLAAVLVCGCQSSGGPSDKKLISAAMADWKAAVAAKDLDKIMAVYSENYVSVRGGGKDSMRGFIKGAIERGLMDNVKVNLEKAETTVEQDKAEFGPVEFISERGTFAVGYTLQKENGTWLIVTTGRQEQ